MRGVGRSDEVGGVRLEIEMKAVGEGSSASAGGGAPASLPLPASFLRPHDKNALNEVLRRMQMTQKRHQSITLAFAIAEVPRMSNKGQFGPPTVLRVDTNCGAWENGNRIYGDDGDVGL